MPSWMEAFFLSGFPAYHNDQAGNQFFGKRRSHNNWEQRKEAKAKKVEKRRAKKKRE